MDKAFCLLLVLLVAACDDPMIRESQAHDIAKDVADARVTRLERRIDELQEEIALVRLEAAQNRVSSSGLRDVVNRNARVANEAAVADMTRRGLCGTEIFRSEGVIYNRPIPCTLDDLRKE